MKPLLSLFCLCFWLSCFAQTQPTNPSDSEAAQKEEYKVEQDIGSRWVYNPRILPVIPIAHKQFDANDEQVEVTNLTNISLGIRAEKYKPNDIIGYGADLDFGYRSFIYQIGREYLFEENYLNFTPFITLKKAGIEKTRHYFVNAGFVNNFIFSTNAKYLNDQRLVRSSGDLSIFKNYRLFGYLELGFKNDVFYSTWNEVKRSSHYTLSLGIFLPFFNQSSTFRNKNGEFENDFEVFRKNRSTYSGIVLNYTQNIDLKMNQTPDPYNDQLVDFYGNTKRTKNNKEEFLSSKNHIYLPPLINFYHHETPYFGNFYIKISNKQTVDSVALEGTLLENPLTDIRTSTYYGFGYSFHFLGNYSNHISLNSRRHGEFQWDFFVSAGLANRIYNIGNWQTLGRYHNFLLELNGGVRLGIEGIYLLAGYEYGVPISTKLVVNEVTYNGFKWDSINNGSIFAGIGFRNSIYFKVAMRDIKTVKMNENPADRFEFTLGFGI